MLARLKIIRIVLIATMIINSFIVNVIAASLKEANIYIFISFSMSEAALKDYFAEAESLGAKLIVRGLVNDSFQETTAIANSLAIRFDIDPNLFEQYGVTVVPTIVVDDGIRPAKKLTGHLPLAKALEIMQKEKEQ